MSKNDDSLDDSWFERPAGGRGVLTREAVMQALADPAVAANVGPSWEGLDDSWFERPPREQRR